MSDKITNISEGRVKPKRSIVKSALLIIILTIGIVIIALYITNNQFRDKIDIYILKKNVTEENLKKIQINSDENPFIYAYDKYIVILSKNILTLYNKDGEKSATINVNVNTPIAASNGKYLVLAENKGKKLCVTSDSNLLWQKDLDGEISGVNVNKNGYVSVIVTNTTYKSVIITFDSNGTELFRTYLSQKYAICSVISDDNRYLAVGEINYSGSVIKSSVKIISIDDARKKKDEAIKYVYDAESGEILLNLNYEKNAVIAVFTNYVQQVTTTGDDRILDIGNTNLFIDIGLKNNIALIQKESTGLFSNMYQLKIINSENRRENIYIIEAGMPKNMRVYGDKILINMGSEVNIVNTNGWLIKKYTSRQEIKETILSENIAGIVYKDKIEIINI